MKVNFSQLLALITISLAATAFNSVFAQEGSPNNEIPELSPPIFTDPTLREEKPLLYEPEGKSNNSKEQTITPAPTKAKIKSPEPTKATASKTEEDALSFNFLYYIIQKFKISDIVDQ
jgi:hypothetical protein